MDGFYRTAARRPDATAVVDDESVAGGEVSFGRLLGRVNAWSNALGALGIEEGSVVAAVLPNGTDLLTIELGTVQLPLYFTPLNWHLTTREIAYILADSGATVVVTDAARLDAVLAAATSAGLSRDRVIVVDGEGGHSLASLLVDERTPPERGAGQRMLYTSGTTGQPKGVRRALRVGPPEEHLGLVAQRASLYGIESAAGVHLVTAPMYHAAPGAYAVQALHLGHTVVMNTSFDPGRALDQIAQHRVTHTYMVPTMFQRLLGLPALQRAAAEMSSLRSVLHTAAPCPPAVKRAMIEWVGPVLYEIYGGTEGGATIVTSPEWLTRPGTVGQARPGVELRILDDAGAPVATGRPGTVYMAIPAQQFEYLNDPAKTAGARHGEFFTLGDIGHLDADGWLFLHDRVADVIVSAGVNIYPAEVEAVLLEHPAVADAGVVGAPDPDRGEQVVAFVQAVPDVVGTTELAAELMAWCRQQIAAFKCPREIEFRDGLPRSDVGKLLRRTLREERWADRQERL